MTGEPLRNDHHVARYCKPSAVGQDGMPMTVAFRLRHDEDYLSVNWLEYFRAPDLSAAVDMVKAVFRSKGYSVRPNGRFAVLGVGAAKTAVHLGVGKELRIESMPLPNDPSHSGILGYTADDLAVSVELKAQLDAQSVHSGVS